MLQRLLSVSLLFCLILTPLSNLYAQEPEVSPVSEAAENASQESPANSVVEQASDEISNSAKQSEDLESRNNSEAQTPKEQPRDETTPPLGAKQATRPQFQIPSQPQAGVDQSTGALIYEYPIDLPKGRAEMTPELSLKYDSRNMSKPDSYVGLGWETSIPYIQRESLEGTQNLYTKPYFSSSMSGNLIASTDTNISQFTSYRSETDNGEYLRYVYNSNNSWTVKDKDGKTYFFGEAPDERQGNPNNMTQVYKWMISKISDPHGNEIRFTYTKDSGQIYPNQITYTFHPSAPAVHTVDFTYYTPENFGSTVYNSAFSVTTTRLLRKITIATTIDNRTSTLIYTLYHTDAQFLMLKNLESVGRSLDLAGYEFTQPFNNATYFLYSTKTPGWEQGTHYLGENLPYLDDTIYNDISTADFDKNGFSDVLVSTRVNGVLHNSFNLNTGTAFVESKVAWSLPNVDLSESSAIVDVNGDHLPDLHFRGYAPTEPHAMYMNTGSGFVADTGGIWEVGTYVPEAFGCGPNVGDNHSFDMNAYFHDINHDGKNDIVYFGGSADFRVFLNNGNGFTRSFDYLFTVAPGANFTILPRCTGDLDADHYQMLIDLNGDGLADYYHEQYGTYLNTGHGFVFNASYDMDIDEMDRSGFADINGDGLLDYIGFKWYPGQNRCARVLFNNGNGFTQINPTSFPGCENSKVWDPGDLRYTNNHREAWGTFKDVTADGFPDIVGEDRSSSAWGKVRSINDAKSTWATNQNPGSWSPLIRPNWGVFFDINSDGVLDFISPNPTWDGDPMPPSKVHMGKPSVPNRLTQITTPLGAQTVITYGTAPTNYSDTDASPMAVVKRITTQNIGHGQPTMVRQYEYTNGVYVNDSATGQNRFTGFHKVTETESGDDLSPIRVTETYFHQANGSDSATNEPPDTSLALIGKLYYSVVRHSTSVPRKETWNKYGINSLITEPSTGRLSNFVHPTETIIKTSESDSVVTTAELYTYDATIGERSELRRLGFVSNDFSEVIKDTTDDARYEFTEYASNSDGTIIQPRRVDVRTSPEPVDTIARTDFLYDGQPHGIIGPLGDLTKETKWISNNGAVSADISYTYDAFGNKVIVTNARNATKTYSYDSSKSLVATETNHLNHTTTFEYMTGLLKKTTDPNGRVTTYGYSSEGWLYRTTVANTGGNQSIFQFLVQDDGFWATQTDIQLVSTFLDRSWQSLDNLARPVRRVRRLLNHGTGASQGYYLKESRLYDALGREVKLDAPYGVPDMSYYTGLFSVPVPPELTTTTTYDIFDRPTSVVDALGTTSFAYSGKQTTIVDANNNQKKTETDAYGNLVKVIEYNREEEYITKYEYDVRDLLTGIKDALGNVRSFSYNNAGWLTRSEDLHTPNDSTFGITSFAYDVNGNLSVETQPNGTTVTRNFDPLDRPLSVDGSTTTATDYTFTYDACTNGKGRVCNMFGNLPNNVTLNKSFVYGISGAPTSVTLTTLGNSYTTGYLYNYSDQVSKTIYPNGAVVREGYGNWGLADKVYVALPGNTESIFANITFHHTEKPAAITFTNGLTLSYSYDNAKLYRKTNMTALMGKNPLERYDYSYDNVNNIKQIQELLLTKNYDYDNLNRLIRAVYTGPNTKPSLHTYSYDAIGNIASANGKIYSYDGGGKTNPHAVTKIGLDNITYDDNGNVTKTQENGCTDSGNIIGQLNLTPFPQCENSNVWNLEKEFYYNWQNQPVIIEIGNRNIVTGAYDETGNRFLYQTPNTAEIQIENNYLLKNNVPEINIDLGNIPLGSVSGGEFYSTVADHLGTPIKQVNSSGIVVEDTFYDPFGKVVSQSGTIDIKQGYTGHQEDTDTGLVYANARYYNPSIARFMRQDPLFLTLGFDLTDPQSLNSYAYSRNNPLRYVDPNGKWFKDLFKQTWNNVVTKVGDFANYLYDHNRVAKFAMDHPLAPAAIGVLPLVALRAPARTASGVLNVASTYVTAKVEGREVSDMEYGASFAAGFGAPTKAGFLANGAYAGAANLAQQVIFQDTKDLDWVSVGISALSPGAAPKSSGVQVPNGAVSAEVFKFIKEDVVVWTVDTFGQVINVLRKKEFKEKKENKPAKKKRRR